MRDCTIHVAKTKTLISFADTAKLIGVFGFAYAKSRFSHNEAQLKKQLSRLQKLKALISLHDSATELLLYF